MSSAVENSRTYRTIVEKQKETLFQCFADFFDRSVLSHPSSTDTDTTMEAVGKLLDVGCSLTVEQLTEALELVQRFEARIRQHMEATVRAQYLA